MKDLSSIQMKSPDLSLSVDEKIEQYNKLKKDLFVKQKYVNEAYENIPTELLDEFKKDPKCAPMLEKAEVLFYKKLEKDKEVFEANRKKLEKRSIIHMTPDSYKKYDSSKYATMSDEDKHVVFTIERLMPLVCYIADTYRNAFLNSCDIYKVFKKHNSDDFEEILAMDWERCPDLKKLFLNDHTKYGDFLSILLFENVQQYKGVKTHKEIMEEVFIPFLYTTFDTIKSTIERKCRLKIVQQYNLVPESDRGGHIGKYVLAFDKDNKPIKVKAMMLAHEDVPKFEYFEFFIGERLEKLVKKHVLKYKPNLSNYGKRI